MFRSRGLSLLIILSLSSWVTSKQGILLSFTLLTTKFLNVFLCSGSKEENGSSSNKTSGSDSIALRQAILDFCPPERVLGYLF